jgi:tetratricopeptide (TPR) repeat protein
VAQGEQARILRVVVASPSDVQPERDAVQAVADELNRGIAKDRGLRLEVARWETDAYPGFHLDGPQGLIDPILRIEDCDILIGIFWKRFGTPTMGAKSGAEHEFRCAYEAWQKNQRPQIMVYFDGKAYAPKSKDETDQWGSVLDFKKDFPKEGLWWPYKGKAEFEKLLREHLTHFIIDNFPKGVAAGSTSVPAPPALGALHQLPPPPLDFTGRKDEIRDLMKAVETGGAVISGMYGMGGMGKTALALKLAQQLEPRFPDAQIYLDLKGVSPEPLTAAAAMAHVIRAWRPEAKLPEGEAELAALYHSALHGQRVLLVMDNAKDAQQVQPLIPPAGCLLLVTSRVHFTLPGLVPKNLDALPPPDACDLLLKIAPRINGSADAMAKLCGYLPIALRAVASAVAETPNLSPADYLRRLGDAKKRLELVDPTRPPGSASVEASLGLSYELLPAELQRQFRALAVFPGTFDAGGAAAVWSLEKEAVEGALGKVVKFSLVDYNPETSRYRLHDLIRAFAEARLDLGERELAERRHSGYYETVAREADRLYKQGGDALKQGLRLFDGEWANIRAGQAWAAARAESEDEAARLCSRYPDAGTYCLSLRLHPRQRIRWREEALGAAHRLQDRGAQAAHLGNLALAYSNLGETRRAIELYEQDLVIVRETGDRRGEGQVLNNLGLAYADLGETRRAIELYEQHLAITREIGDRRGEANALGNLGLAYADLGDTRRAIEFHEQALAIDREIGDRRGEGQDRSNLGNAYKDLGETRRAIELYEQALAIDREIGDRRGEANSLNNLGLAYADLGETRRAIDFHEQSRAIKREIGDRRGEANSLNNLGLAYADLGETRRAIELYEQSLVIKREIGDRRGEGNALFNMSLALHNLGNRAQASAHAEAALGIYEQIEDPNAARVRRQLEEWRKPGA